METGEKHWVIRLSILFNDEDPTKLIELNRVGAANKDDKKDGKNKKRRNNDNPDEEEE